MAQKSRLLHLMRISMALVLIGCALPAALAQAPQTDVSPMEAAPSPQASEPLAVPADGSMSNTDTAADRPHDLSIRGMIEQADIVVKAVMTWLALCVFATWVILIAKGLETIGANRAARGVAKKVDGAGRLDEALGATAGLRTLPARMVAAAQDEVEASTGMFGDGLLDRVHSRLGRMQAGAAAKLARGTGILASIGATAPFVGLFGTVWGIMNAFIGISEAQTTNLAVVAPGIAEALLATAMGLVAAIPAVIFYNIFSRANAGYRHVLTDIAAALERLVSRDLDRAGQNREIG